MLVTLRESDEAKLKEPYISKMTTSDFKNRAVIKHYIFDNVHPSK